MSPEISCGNEALVFVLWAVGLCVSKLIGFRVQDVSGVVMAS